jgi:hypothetical protein
VCSNDCITKRKKVNTSGGFPPDLLPIFVV